MAIKTPEAPSGTPDRGRRTNRPDYRPRFPDEQVRPAIPQPLEGDVIAPNSLEAAVVIPKPGEAIPQPRRVLQQEPDAFEKWKKAVAKRAGVVILAGAGIATALAGYNILGLSGSNPNTSPSSRPSATDVLPTQTPDVLRTPDHFPLNPKTLEGSGMNIVASGQPISQEIPYAYNLVIYAPTIENVQKNPDGSETITMVLPGGPIATTDMNKSVTNFDGSVQEQLAYNTSSATEGRTVIQVVIKPGTGIFSSKGYSGEALDLNLKPGSADWDFVISMNYDTEKNLASLKTLQQTAASGGGLTSPLNFTAGYLSPNTSAA